MQLPLLGAIEGGESRFDGSFSGAQRRVLDDDAWVELVPGWVQGHLPLFNRLREDVRWESHRRWMYERVVEVPRLTGGREGVRLDLLESMADALGRRYRTAFRSIAFALYRDGRDSVAYHRDKEIRELAEAHVALVILGEPRLFSLRPFGGGGPSIAFKPGWGDLLVMGGGCQRTWEHAVPKVRHAGPRMSIMFREALYLGTEEPGRVARAPAAGRDGVAEDEPIALNR